MIGSATQVHVEAKEIEKEKNHRDFELEVTNANPWPVAFEASFTANEAYRIERFSARMSRKYGRPLWQVKVPANGSTTLRYRITAAMEKS